MSSAAIRGTYRLQLTPTFGFAEVARVAPYLAELGVSHAYLSPILQAEPGSQHGYDVIDPARVSQDLGGESAFVAMAETLQGLGLGILLDLVPNHMALSTHNPYLWSVLEQGRDSPWARVFDIDWDAGVADNRGKLVLPTLGDRYARVLESDDLRLVERDGQVQLALYDACYPLRAEGRPEVGELSRYNDDPARLHALLQSQHYALMYWRAGVEEVNYRRFFNVSSLIATRALDPEVFDLFHRVPLDLHRRGLVQGFRIDHPDGLSDPKAYVERLRAAAPDAYLALEKILEADETLPTDWPVQGTTGYDAMRVLDGVMFDPRGHYPLQQAYENALGEAPTSFSDQCVEGKRLVLARWFHPEVRRLTEQTQAAMRDTLVGTDAGYGEVERVVTTLLMAMPTYRTYGAGLGNLSEADREVLRLAQAFAHDHLPEDHHPLLGLLCELLSSEATAGVDRPLQVAFEQLATAVMAKGVEDTAFYRYNLLSALNEVGGEPGSPGISADAFHAFFLRRWQTTPHALNASSTHDTKRGEDTRLQMLTASSLSDAWDTLLETLWHRWLYLTAQLRPGPNPLYLLLQTWVGAFPLDEERLREFMLKAAREAKVHTSWFRGRDEYEERLAAVVHLLHTDEPSQTAIEAFVTQAQPLARRHGLLLAALKALVPGVPDCYQGSERDHRVLADPDNRGQVDFDQLARALQAHRDAPLETLVADDYSAAKQQVIARTLALRARRPESFGAGPEGRYQPLTIAGPEDEAGNRSGPEPLPGIAFARGEAVWLVGALHGDGAGQIDDTATLEVPQGRFTDILSGRQCQGGRVRLRDAVGPLGVAIYEVTT